MKLPPTGTGGGWNAGSQQRGGPGGPTDEACATALGQPEAVPRGPPEAVGFPSWLSFSPVVLFPFWHPLRTMTLPFRARGPLGAAGSKARIRIFPL